MNASQSTTTMSPPVNQASVALDRDKLLDLARERASLGDFGDTWFLEPMDKFLEAANREACLTAPGVAATTEQIVRGLVNRLRMVEDIKRHPEILDEEVHVAGIILGLPRTGSTIFHRLLASAPGMTAMHWFELQNHAPFPGEEIGKASDRKDYAQAMIKGWLEASPDLESIHPLDPDAPDEEIILLGQMFVSTFMEGMTFVPSFSDWLDGYDQSQGHRDLTTVLKYLQWQDPSRRGRRWVLKSPSNLPYAQVAAEAFPEALLVMTHRDPVETVPSYISMQVALYKLSSDLSEAQVADFWFHRLARWMELFEAARARIGDDRFIDIDYRAVTRAPQEQAESVLERMGVAPDAEVEIALREFIAGNKREQRPAHAYSLERFGLSEDMIREAFASYRDRYILS